MSNVNSDDSKRCPKCGQPLAGQSMGGLCPNCLVQVTFGEDSQAAKDKPPLPNKTVVIPKPPPSTLDSRPSTPSRIRYFGDYELLEEIARGGMGVVYKARQVSLNRVVAVKMILGGHLANDADVQRFHAEAEAAANLNHPHIVAIHEVGVQEDQHYFSMDYVEGVNLSGWMGDQEPEFRSKNSEVAKITWLMVKVCRAVHYAHQRGVIHRDLKPGNILVDRQGEPHLTDFGLAKRTGGGSDITVSGAVLGTPAYMAPEQARGKTKEITTAADVYSLGAILYHLLTGQPPFAGESTVEILQAVVNQEPVRPALLNQHLDQDLETICLKCLEKDPSRRYCSAEAIADDLERWLQHEPIEARPITTTERLVKWARRKPRLAAMTAALVILGILGVAGIEWQRRETEGARAKATAAEAVQVHLRQQAELAEALLREALVSTAKETLVQRDARMAWWRDARFGMFIHWGPVSIKGTDLSWSRGGERRGYGSPGNQVPLEEYDNLYKIFNPTNFNAREWVQIAKAAGMKYMGFTSRHHDGFSMFDTAASDYKITSPLSPFHRDVVKELADACHAEGMHFGLYYSQPNWYHPDAFTSNNHAKYIEFLHKQIREILTKYGKIEIIWFDGQGKKAADYDALNVNQMIRQLQPGILINNRNGIAEDFDAPEQRINKFQYDRPWETWMSICQQWSWKPNDEMKSLKQCLQRLIQCAGGDGNLLLNLGPMPTGAIEPRQVTRLKEMGEWLKQYGESIYGTRGGPYMPGSGVASTRKSNVIYLHVLDWKNDTVTVPDLPAKIQRTSVLTGGQVSYQQADGNLIFSVSANDRNANDTIIKLELVGSAMQIPAMPLKTPSISVKSATASNIFQNDPKYGANKAVDGDKHSRWATDPGTKHAWLELELKEPSTVGQVSVAEAFGGRVQKFELQYFQNGQWQTVLMGSKLGSAYKQSFPTVVMHKVRLNILEATDAPTLTEVSLLPPIK